jgi:hypothetical protein
MSVDEANQMLFLQSPPNQRRISNRLMSPTGTSTRPGAHSSYNNRPKQIANPKQVTNSSSLGFKTTGTLASNNTLKIQNIRMYNETSQAVPATKNSMTTK